MTAAALLEDITAAGIRLELTDRGTLHYQGDQAAVDCWLPEIRTHKAELLELLRPHQERARLWRVVYPERELDVVYPEGMEASETQVRQEYHDAIEVRPIETTVRRAAA